jgi:hypothetical protein
MTTPLHSAPCWPQARFGLPVSVLVGLALLAVPRVVLHDLGVVQEGTLVNGLLVFGPSAVWIVTAVLTRVPNPLLTLVAVGVIYGVFLATGHQVLWNTAWAGDPPQLGGNLAGQLSTAAESLILRAAAALSSLVTGSLVGAVSGLVAWGLARGRRYVAARAFDGDGRV